MIFTSQSLYRCLIFHEKGLPDKVFELKHKFVDFLVTGEVMLLYIYIITDDLHKIDKNRFRAKKATCSRLQRQPL